MGCGAAGRARAMNGRWWWLLFTDPERPEGEQFLGVAIVPSHSVASDDSDIVQAGARATSMGCTPRGQFKVTGYPVPAESVLRMSASFVCRLLTLAEVESLEDAMTSRNGFVLPKIDYWRRVIADEVRRTRINGIAPGALSDLAKDIERGGP